MTGLQFEEKPTDLDVKQYVPEKTDPMGLKAEIDAVRDFEPDLVYTTGDPGTVASHAMVHPARIPFYAYVPIEGEPIILPEWQGLLRAIPFMTCSQYGRTIAQRDLQRDVDMVYHGVDRDVFSPDAERREAVRAQLGWTDKFVVMTVAANVRRKQHPRLIEAISILKHHFKQQDVVLYDHTVPFQSFWLEGWNLPVVADAFSVHDEVVFNPLLGEFGASIPDSAKTEVPSLADLYRAADLFVLPSQVEGFGLPIAEAMASGVPVAVTKYGAGWEVASKGQGAAIPVHDWEIAKAGTKYANVDPMALAKLILDLKRDPKRRARMSAAGIEGSKAFNWAIFEEKVVDEIESVLHESATASSPEAVPTVAGQ